MRIIQLEITNFRAIERLQLDDLGGFVVIAGANGSGKTTILDALRLVKSSYVAEEANQWMGEFGIQQNRPAALRKLLRDSSKSARVRATFQLAEAEIDFLDGAVENIFASILYNNRSTRDGKLTIDGDSPLYPADFPAAERDAIAKESRQLATTAKAQLAAGGQFTAALEITNAPSQQVEEDALAFAALTCFAPARLGEMDFHTSARSYNRQGDGNINIRLGDNQESQSRFLYGWQNKYQNLKTRLSEELVRAKLSGGVGDQGRPLESALKDLFTTFFPDKQFLGIEVEEETNQLRFDVQLSTGEKHDIDELSSGEKEIVYGYLWLRSATPRHSVVMIDEPELHLNPALLQGLPDFYRTHLGEALQAQVWIVTHSDAILRTAARSNNMKVFHVARAYGDATTQALEIASGDAVETAVIDLIGDLAAYRPHATIVLVEGSKDTRFDVDVVRKLFPELSEQANFIPAGNRRGTERSAERLREILVETGLTARAVSICDGDADGGKDSEGRFYWPVYEIENFLLEPSLLRETFDTMLRQDPFGSDEAITEELRRIARAQVDRQAAVLVQRQLNDDLVTSLKVRFGPENPLSDLVASAGASVARVAEYDTSRERISDLFEGHRRELSIAVESELFLRRFPGDRLIQELAGSAGLNGDNFKNVCLERARMSGYRPEAMASTLDTAIAAGRQA